MGFELHVTPKSTPINATNVSQIIHFLQWLIPSKARIMNFTTLSVALNSSCDILPDVAGFVSNGQRGTYSKRRRVEMCNRAEGMMHKTQYYTVIDDLVSFSLAKYLF